MTERLLTHLLTANTAVAPLAAAPAWWAQHRELETAWSRPIERSIAGGFAADRVGWAFAGAYQAALRVLVPTLASHVVAALCVTEAQGTAPRAMQTTLSEDAQGALRLDGAKRWTTLGPEGGLFLVAARDARVHGERPAIRLVQVPAHADGVQVQPMPPTAFVPEIPHAQLRFDQVRVPAEALLPGDGYTAYVKPFRTIEDLHVHAAVLAYLVRESRRLAWPQAWTEQAVSVLLGFSAIADLDPTAATTHLALAGAMTAGEELVQAGEVHWSAGPDAQAAARWQRDRKLLGLAAQARMQRRERAWAQLGAGALRTE